MKTKFALCLATILGSSLLQFAQAQGNREAARLAREGTEAAKDQDWDKAIDLFRKAADMDKKFAPNLAVAYQQRGYVSQKEQRFNEAIADFGEAIKVNPRDTRIYEQRAAVEMKINALDQALADYSETIKLNPNEVRFYLYRGYIYELKGDIDNSMAETEKALKVQPKNPDAVARKERLQKIKQAQSGAPPPLPVPARTPPPAAPARTP